MLTQIIAVLGGVGALVAIIAAVVKAPAWWAGERRRVTQAVRAAEPDLYFHVSSYGGAGQGFICDLKNRGATIAYRLSLLLPGGEQTRWQTDELRPGVAVAPQVPLEPNAAVLRERLPGAEAVLIYHDKLGLEYKQRLALLQTKRDDGAYNCGTSGAPRGCQEFRVWGIP